jgi:nuclear GTP-binding protein
MSKRNKAGNMQAQRKDFNKKKFTRFTGAKPSGINKSGNASTNPDRKIKPGSEGFYRTKATIKRLKMYDQKPDMEARKVRPDKPARIEPDRKWFGNTRTIDQKSLENLRKEIDNQSHDTYSLLLKKRKIPQSLITPLSNVDKINKLHNNFQDTFGPNSKRKKPNLKCYTMEEYAESSGKKVDDYEQKNDINLNWLNEKEKIGPETKYMTAGQSKRIYSELYKVIDSSDVICSVIDARDPMGTRSYYVENFVKKNAPHKHIIFILNKCDLVPTWATAAWIKILSKEYPTLAFHASVTNPFGKPALFQILRQFDALHKDKKTISIGFIGYPNVGKSSVINTLKKTAVCKAAPIPGETKVWQYVALTKRIYLIDCPGVVYDGGVDTSELGSETDKVLKGVLRAEKIQEPLYYIPGILAKAKKEYLQKIYKVTDWVDHEDFVGQIAINHGKLLKGGEPDTKAMSKKIVMDWQRGKIPFFVPPPHENDKMEIEGNENKNKEYGVQQDVGEIIVSNEFKGEIKEEVKEN